MTRWLRAWWTAHRLRVMVLYGWCPECRSSPPMDSCYVCKGDRRYGPDLSRASAGLWADRYVRRRINL